MARQTVIDVKVNSSSAVKGINTIKNAFIDLNKTIKEVKSSDDKIKLDIDLSGFDLTALKQVNSALNKLSKNLDKYGNSIDIFSKKGQLFNVTTNNIQGNLQQTINKNDKFNNSLLTSVATFEVFRRSFSSVYSEYMEFSNSLFNVGIAGQMNISQIEELSNSFLSLSTTVPASANELARAVDDLIRTGRSYEESRQIIEEVAKLSTASGDSLKDTAQVVTKVMVSLGVSGDRVTETLDTMHSTAIQTASDMGYLAEAFKNVAGGASVMVKQSGLAGEELDDYRQQILDLSMASIGSLANLGLSASQAGTKVKNLFNRLVAGEKSARALFDKAMELQSIKMEGSDQIFNFDQLSNMAKKDLPQAVELMSKLYIEGKLGTQVMQKMFTARHFMEISNLLIDINGNINEFTEGITKGVNYLDDYQKNLLNINQQTKLLKNNIQSVLGESNASLTQSFTGLLMVLNNVLNTIDKGNPTAKKFGSSLFTLGVSVGGVTTGVMALSKAFTSLGGTTALISTITSPISLALVSIAGLLTLVGKNTYETQRNFVDLGNYLNSFKSNTNQIDRELKKIETTVNLLNVNYKEATSPIGLETSLGLMDRILDKSKEFKDVLGSTESWKAIPQDEINKLQDESTQKLSEYRKEYLKLQSDIENLKKEAYKSASGVSFKGLLPKQTRDQILDAYFSEDLVSKNFEEKLNSIVEKFKGQGITETQIKSVIGSVDMSEFKTVQDELEKNKEKVLEYNEALRTQFEQINKQLSANITAQNKHISYIASLDLELLKLQGDIDIDGQKYKGIEAYFKIFETASIKSVDKELETLKNTLKSLEETRKNTELLPNSKEKEEELKKIDNRLFDVQNKIKTISDKKYTDSITNNFKKAGESLKNLVLNEKDMKWVAEYLALTEMIAKYEQESDPISKEKLDKLKIEESKVKAILDVISEQNKAKKEATTYQIKYTNYLKASLDSEEELLKLTLSRGQSDAISYQYKLKELEINKKIAESEVEINKQAIEGLNINQKEKDLLKGITSSKDAQKLIDQYYAQNKGLLKGEKGKLSKDFYDALKEIAKAMSEQESLQDKLGALVNKQINDFSNTTNEIIIKSMETAKQLSELGIGNFKNYNIFTSNILNAMNNQYKSNLDKFFLTYNIPNDTPLETVMEDIISEITNVQNLKGNQEGINAYIENILSNIKDSRIKETLSKELTLTGDVEKDWVTLMNYVQGKYKDLNLLAEEKYKIAKSELEVQLDILDVFNKMGNTVSSFGSLFNMDSISKLGDALSSLGEFQKTISKNKVFLKDLSIGDLFDEKTQADMSKKFASVFENALSSINFGQAIGSFIGSIGGMSTIGSQQGGALGGLISTGMGLSGWRAVASVVGGSLLGGLFGKDSDDQAEAEQRTKEQNKIYNKNTEALQKLAQNMANLNGGIDSLNSTLISSFSKIPTVDKLDNVNDALTNMYKTMEKTRIFEDVAYQVTKTKKSGGGLFGGLFGGGGSTSWTETIEVSVDEMLRRYGFKGAIEDMSTDQLREFSKWLDEYDMGDSDNFGILADAIEDYAEALDKFGKNIDNFFKDTTLESFEGISSIQQEELRQQIEDFYKNLGLQIDDEMLAQIDKLAEEMSVMVTIMQDVRSEFLNSWRQSGEDAGKVFVGAMKPYIDAMLTNMSQIYYDVYFSGLTESLEKDFKELSEKLVELKKQGEDLDWDSVTDEISESFGNVIDAIISAKGETESFNEILLKLQQQALEAGLSLSEIADLGLLSGTQSDVLETFKDALTSSEADSALTSIGEMVGDKIGEAMANKMIDNLLSDKILEFSAQIDKIVSGSMNFEELASLANEALQTGLMMENERQRLEAIRDLFSMGDITYETQDNEISYSSGVSQSVINNYYLSSSVEAGNVIESDDLESLASELLDIMLEKLKTDKGINLNK